PVAPAPLDAAVQSEGPRGRRTIPIVDFHRLPGDTPQVDTNLQHDELITAVDLPASTVASRSHYVKVRDRASYAFALVSAAVALDAPDGTIRAASIALGGVAHKPWGGIGGGRSVSGERANRESIRGAAGLALTGGRAYDDRAVRTCV